MKALLVVLKNSRKEINFTQESLAVSWKIGGEKNIYLRKGDKVGGRMSEKEGEEREYGRRSLVPPGFRFHPTDEELINFYLRKKVGLDKFELDHVICEVDLNKLEPWDLCEKCKLDASHQIEWYFFSHKDKKYPTGTRTNRATKAGFWKATGRDKVVLSSLSKPHKLGGQRIGMRKTLVFYKGRAPHGLKTDWIMHEYRLQEVDPGHATKPINEDGWVVCRVFKKKNYEEKSSTSASSYDHSHSNLSDEEPSPIKTSNSISSTPGVRSMSSSKSAQKSYKKQGEIMNYNNSNIAPTIKVGGNNLALFSCKQEVMMDQNEGPNGIINNQSFFNQLPYLENIEKLGANYHAINNNYPSLNITYNPLNVSENQIKRVEGSQKIYMDNSEIHQEGANITPHGGKAFFMNEEDLAHYIDNNMNPSGQHLAENIQYWSLYDNLTRLQGTEPLATYANDQVFPYFNNLHLSKVQAPIDSYPSSYEIELWNFPR